MKTNYNLSVQELNKLSQIDIEVVESNVDLYYNMALSMYTEIEKNNKKDRKTVMILPVGPVFQYRRFINLLSYRPLLLNKLHIFFMDEYLKDGTKEVVESNNPLSFQGFIDRELKTPLSGKYGFNPKQIYFPNPQKPEEYDKMIEELDGVDLCHAGVGIVGHLAFNEPIAQAKIELEDFIKLPTRIVDLTKETIVINSNTAMGGAFEEIPKKAVTIGMASILESRRLEIYMNRTWQASVLRKTVMLPPTSEFPASCIKQHKNLKITISPQVAEIPNIGLK